MKYSFFLLFLLIIATFYGQIEPRFTRFTSEDGLPANYVQSTYQDSKGFLWFGMRGGCCRFDGYNFKTFQLSMPSGKEDIITWIRYFAEDSNHLYVGEVGDYGLFIFDSDNEMFRNYVPSLELPESISKIMTRSLMRDSADNIWIGTNENGVIIHNSSQGKTTHLTHNPHDSNSIPQGGCIKVIELGNGRFLLGFISEICIYDLNADTIEHISNLSISKLLNLFEDSENKLWYINDGMLFEFNIQERSSKKVCIENNDSKFNLPPVGEIIEDSKNNFWLGSSNGLVFINDKKTSFQTFKHDENDPKSLSSNMVKYLFIDRTKNLWICTSQGVSKFKKQRFKTYKHSDNEISLSENKVHSLIEYKNDEIYIALLKGIDKFNPLTGHFEKLTDFSKYEVGLTGNPLALFKEDNKGLWIGTWNDGLFFLNFSTGKLKNYLNDPEDSNSLCYNSIFSLNIDSKKNFWVGTWGRGLDLFNRNDEKFIHFRSIKNDSLTIQSDYIRTIYEDSKHNIWVGTLKGVARIQDINSKKVTRVLTSDDFNTTKNVLVYSILEGKTPDYIWIGANIGLFRYHIPSKSVKRFSGPNLLPQAQIFGILKDNKGNLWISSSRGLIVLEANYNESVSNINFKVYKKSDGLQGDEFLPGSYCKLEDGTMLFGGTNGFSMFHPDSISNDPNKPMLALTKLEISNKKVEIGDTINKQVVLSKSITNTKQLVLNYKNNNFSIEFTALHFNQPEHNKYLYFLEGFDTEWHNSNSNERKANYMNLKGGDYTFRVKASNSDGLWNEKGISLKITVLPPWWKTWWFRISVVLFLSLIIVAYYRYRLNTLKRQKRILERKVFERTQELREANSQLEEKQEEIMQQNEEIITVNNQLKSKNEEILHVNNQLTTKNEEIEAQKEEIEASRNQLEKAFKNIQVLSEFGQKITATFDFDTINKMIYDYVSSLMDTAAFGVGIYNEKRKIIDFPYFMEQGRPVPYFFKDLLSAKSLSVRCFKNSEEIIINDLSSDYKNYLSELPDVQTTQMPSSIIHLPLIVEHRPIGTLTVNSFKKNAYNENDIANLRTLASYISIALDNSKAYRIIRSKNEQISGSIRYGQTIQQAMLPPKEQIDKYFENFILFRPKDIVSGDFYWFATVQNYYFLAVVDCTGHGVPGAFMSMIGSRLLNDIVIERKIYSPAKILEQLNIMIRKALRQDTTDNHDGMDVCLCRFQKSGSNWELTYAGAKRSLLFFNSESNMIEEIQGTRRSIGGVAARKSIIDFTEVARIIKEEDVFYLSTDGLVDQCNPQKRKFSQKKLVGDLGEIQHLTLLEQHKYLGKELDSFQAGFEQRDDISLIGIKIKNGQGI